MNDSEAATGTKSTKAHIQELVDFCSPENNPEACYSMTPRRGSVAEAYVWAQNMLAAVKADSSLKELTTRELLIHMGEIAQ